jgi:hypothetical protein
MRAYFRHILNGILVAAVFGLASAPASAEYDKDKCPQAVGKLKNFIKEYKKVKLQEFFDEVDGLDDEGTAIPEERYNKIFDMPFDDKGWVNKYQDRRNDVKDSCVGEQQPPVSGQ